MKACWLRIGLAFLCLCATPVAGQDASDQASDTSIVEITNLTLSRARLKKKVSAEVTVRNTGAAELTAISLAVSFLEEGKELRKTDQVVIKKLKPGKSETVTLSAEQCPYFTGYRLFLQYKKDKQPEKYAFRGQPGNLPTLERTSPAKGRCLLAILDKKSEWKQVLEGGKRVQKFALSLKVKNEGDVPCANTDSVLKFYNDSDKLLKSFSTRLEKGDIPGWTERQFTLEVAADGTDGYSYYTIEVIPVVPESDAVMEGGEFTDAPIVEAANWKLERNAGTGLTISGEVRNGLDHTIVNVVVRAMLEGEKGEQLREVCYMLETGVKPGEVVPFVTRISEPPPYANFSFDVTYDDEPVEPGGGETGPQVGGEQE